MEVKISAKHMELTPAIEEYAMKKLDRLTRYFDRIQQIEMIVDRVKIGYELEIITNVANHDAIIATSEHEDLYACIDLCVDRSTRQLTDHKSRLRDDKHTTSTGGKEV